MEQKTLEKRISELSTDNKEVKITLEYLLDLVSKANSLYESSRIDRKRKILNLVFSCKRTAGLRRMNKELEYSLAKFIFMNFIVLYSI